MSINNLQQVGDYVKCERPEVNEHQATERGELAAVSASSQPAAGTPWPSGARSAMGPPTGSDGGMEPGADFTEARFVWAETRWNGGYALDLDMWREWWRKGLR